jgi:hypothetical protein
MLLWRRDCFFSVAERPPAEEGGRGGVCYGLDFARGRERVYRWSECALPVRLVAGMAMSWLFWCG